EELLFNFTDSLNMLYVAATRTRNHLYITAPGQGKIEAKTSIAGDLILEALKKPINGLTAKTDETGFWLDEPVVESAQKSSAEEKIEMQDYPLSKRLEKALESKKVWDKLDLLSGDAAQHKGIILHELLSRTMDLQKLPKVLEEMQQEGLMRQGEKVEIRRYAQSVIENRELKALLNKSYQNLSEQTIINTAGESYRPDKLLIGEEEVLILDFKFTATQRPEHQTQVHTYQKLLQNMGYQNVKGYLYYGFLEELVEVG
ncbi:MAG: Dna2/Cas4 domain-containing protein, partial [Sphingobacteriaceae bacterium]